MQTANCQKKNKLSHFVAKCHFQVQLYQLHQQKKGFNYTIITWIYHICFISSFYIFFVNFLLSIYICQLSSFYIHYTSTSHNGKIHGKNSYGNNTLQNLKAQQLLQHCPINFIFTEKRKNAPTIITEFNQIQ